MNGPNLLSRRANLSLFLLLWAVVVGACHAEEGLPGDVREFVARREKCDHFRGEEATDDKRAAFLEAKVKEFCTGTDRRLTQLRQKYSGNAPATKALAGFESGIE